MQSISIQPSNRQACFKRLPAGLRERPQWCIAGEDKAPLMVDGRRASVTDPTTWTDFDSASRAANGRLVGFVLSPGDPFACIDLDVKDGTPPEHVTRFDLIVSEFDSYTERSRSGRGLHVWIEGEIGKGRRRDGVEVYSQDRFIICTGDVVHDKPVAARGDLLNALVAEMGTPPPAGADLGGEDCPDYALAAAAAEDVGELGRLFNGDWQGRYASQSEADLALVKLLLPHTESPRECWLTFRLSNLGKRDKAERADYARSTIALAAEYAANDAAQVRHGRELAGQLLWKAPANDGHFRLLLDGDLDEQPPLKWLVKRVIPDAGIGAIYGDSGTFKSFLTLDLLAHIANGEDWFEHRVTAAPAVYVPFEGQGGIPNRIRAWRLAKAAAQNRDLLPSTTPPDHVRSNVAVIIEPMNLRDQVDRDKLVATLTESGWAGGALCIDTLAQASNGLDENSSAMAEMLGIFRELQHRLGGVILVIHHSGKDQSRGMRGWSGLHAAMDFVVECQREKPSSRTEAQFVLTKVKDGACGPPRPFRMESVQLGVDEDGEAITSLVVVPSVGISPSTRLQDSERDDQDDEFVWEWVKRERDRGEYPSGRSLEGQREKQMGRDRVMSQKRLRDAIHRLRAASRLVDSEEKAPSGNVYLEAVPAL